MMKRQNVYYVYCVCLFCWVNSAFAINPSSPSLGGVANNMLDPVIGIISIVRAISIIAGIGMVLSSFAKFADHRRNRQEISLVTVFTIFVAGSCLIGVGFIPFRGL